MASDLHMRGLSVPGDIAALVDDRPEEGVFRVHADAFRRRDIFELELEHIFDSTWVFVGLECRIPEPHDFITTHIGRQPVLVSRDGDGKIHCLLNSCRHRGAVVCEHAAGNRRVHVCPYHGWSYSSSGRNVGVTAEDDGAYPTAFRTYDRDLRRAARIASYRGFIFASLNPDVVPLDEYLGETRVFLDLVVDQSRDGLEVLPGVVTYTYRGNWKMQLENSADTYHFVPTHLSYLQILKSRGSASGTDTRRDRTQRGSFTFKHGHNVYWGELENPESRPQWLERADLLARVGENRFKWMLMNRNLLIFPNLQVLENAALQIRVNRPLAADLTEITTYCVAPRGESKRARAWRLRQYEEFYNPSGLATPDDLAIFDACQTGQQGDAIDWHQGYMRGLADVQLGPDNHAAELGINPVTSIASEGALGDETVFHSQYREWRRLMVEGLTRRKSPARIRLDA